MEEKKIRVIHLQMVKDDEVIYGKQALDTPRDTAALARRLIGDMDRECLMVCATDIKMKPTYIQIVGIGTINYCPASIPEVFKAVLLSNSANILLAHNHPSGDCTPSSDDLEFTERVMRAGELLGIRLIDHIIVGGGDSFYSLREEGGFFRREGID